MRYAIQEFTEMHGYIRPSYLSLWMLVLLLARAWGMGVISKMQAGYNKLQRRKFCWVCLVWFGVFFQKYTHEQQNHKKLQKNLK